MAWYRCEYGTGGGGGGGITPSFSKTVLCDNTQALATSITLSDDYENYDLVRFTIWNTSNSRNSYIVTTPEIINNIFTYSSGRLNFNELGNNKYCYYTKTSNTEWTRGGSRDLLISKVEGLTATNCTVTKTTIYNRQAITNSEVSITSQSSLFDYDLILMAACDGNSTETQPCYFTLHPYNGDVSTYLFNSYNTYPTIITLSEYGMSAAKYHMVQGIKFT